MSEQGSVDSPQEAGSLDRKSVQICEDPDSKQHLEALFQVLQTSQSPKQKPMSERKGLPDSFFNSASASTNQDLVLGLKQRHLLGPSISVDPSSGPGTAHYRSWSLPVNIGEREHGRQGSFESPLPPGWEQARTGDGLPYYIDHNTKLTTWEDPRKLLSRQPRPSVPHNLQQQQAMPPYPPPAVPQHVSQQSLDSAPIPEGWQKAYTAEGEVYYVNHNNRTTSWFHPGLSQHHHSHSFAGMPGGMGRMPYPYSRQPGMNVSLQQDLRRRQYEMQRQDQMMQQHAGNEANRLPTTLYNDPYLSSSSHTRQTSHDSGLGNTAMPYPPDGGVEFEEAMDMSTGLQPVGGSKTFSHGHTGAPPNRTLEFEKMPGTNIDEPHNPMPTDQDQMEGDFLGGLAWV